LDHFIFTSGGSESSELALRLARRYWRSKGANKYKIVSLYDSYHGASLGALSATGLGKGALWRGADPLVPGFIHIPSYYCYRCAFGKEYPDCDIQCAWYLGYVVEREGPETVAAFIAEPAQGSAGHIIPPPEYWPIVRGICKEYDLLLVADEVMTGFCRSGRMFAIEHWETIPDIMTMAKGITGAYFPFGAITFSGEIFATLKDQFFSGYTYSGQPTGAAAAIKAMDIYVNEKVAENTQKMGQYALERLNAEFSSLPCVGHVGGLGLMIGIEIVADKEKKRPFEPSANIMKTIQDETLNRGLFIRVAPFSDGPGDRCLFCPPLVATAEQIDRMLDILKPVLAALRPL
jgi:adenosylmethionine-8-amino-7-oxononanoate aminotransferase